MKKYLGFIVVTFLFSCKKDVIQPIVKVETPTPIVNSVSYKGYTSLENKNMVTDYVDATKDYFQNTSTGGGVIAYMDFDNDGDFDIFAARSLNRGTFFYENRSGAYIPVNKLSDSLKFELPRYTLVGDLNNDGYQDLIVLAHGDETHGMHGEIAKTLINKAGKGFDVRNFADTLLGWHVGSLGDIDNDGDLDAIIADVGDVFCFKNDGLGNFTKDTTVLPKEVVGSHLIGASLFDVDGDGYLDCLVHGNEYASLDPIHYHNGMSRTTLFYGNSKHNFLEKKDVFKIDTSGFGLIIEANAYDIDGDGIKEIIMSRTGDPINSIFYKWSKISVHKRINGFWEEIWNKVFQTNAKATLRVNKVNGKILVTDLETVNGKMQVEIFGN